MRNLQARKSRIEKALTFLNLENKMPGSRGGLVPRIEGGRSEFPALRNSRWALYLGLIIASIETERGFTMHHPRP